MPFKKVLFSSPFSPHLASNSGMHLKKGNFMNARILLAGLLLVAMLQPSIRMVSAENAPANRPNIIFIFSDDHARHAISAYGSKINKTPHIDRIAREGAILRNSFCTNSICGPSRAVILTGKHSHLNGMPTNSTAFNGAQQTFPKLLQNAGYETAMVGKWHLTSTPTGFDYWRILPGQGSYYNPDFISPQGTQRIEGYVTDITTNIALDWMKKERNSAKPFLLMLQHKAPHRPWQPGPEHLTMYDDVEIPEPATLFDDYQGRTTAAAKTAMTIDHDFYGMYDLKLPEATFKTAPWELGPYKRMNADQKAKWDAAYGPKNKKFLDAMKAGQLTEKQIVQWKYQRYIKDYLRCVASMDDNIGRVLDYLDESGLAKNTIIIYSSDQGFYLGDRGWYDKRWMYEESMHMPFVIRWPGVIKPGTQVTPMVQNIDYGPTFLEAAGVQVPQDMQGKSIVPLLKGETEVPWRKSIYYHYTESPSEHEVPFHYGVRTERYKLIHYYKIDEWELFDLQNDPGETRSVYQHRDYINIVKDLTEELKRLRKHYQDNTGKGL